MLDHIEQDNIFLSPSKEFLGSSLLRNSFFLPLHIHFSLSEKSIERINLACFSHKFCSKFGQSVFSDVPNVFDGKVCKPFRENALRSDEKTNVQSYPEVCEKCRPPKPPFDITFSGKNLPLQRDIISWMDVYLKGKQSTLSLPLNLDALSPFSRSILQKVAEIPFGKTFTYGEIAKQIGSPSAFRAVGNALNKNPFPLLIPCHRVIGKNDSGGFAYGIAIKKLLLTFENRGCFELRF